jgi:hypothetical protein
MFGKIVAKPERFTVQPARHDYNSHDNHDKLQPDQRALATYHLLLQYYDVAILHPISQWA